MITRQHQQDGLGIAYVQAIAAMAGCNMTIHSIHDYKVDGSFHKVVKIRNLIEQTGHTLEFQLKSSYDYKITGGFVKFDLEVKNYNHLVRRSNDPNGTRAILILFCMPKNLVDWVNLTPEQMIMRHCCYYHQLKGQETENDYTQVVNIPQNQLLTDITLRSLLDIVGRGERDLC